MAGMKPAERAMFQESYADALARKMDAMSDRRDVTTALFNSPQERAKIGAVFGPQGVDRLQAFINREKIFDAARHALGNSTTVRQMIEAGLAGGAAGGILSGGDWHAIGEGALTGAGAGLGAAGSGLVRHGVLTGARTALGYIDRNTAARVARLLASNNPRELMEGLKMAARDKRVASRLGDMGARAAAMPGALKRPRVPLALLPGSPQGQRQRDDVPSWAGQDTSPALAARAKGGRVTHADDKISKVEAHYRPRGGVAQTRCGTCQMFRPPWGCTAVEGHIAPGGVCALFKRALYSTHPLVRKFKAKRAKDG